MLFRSQKGGHTRGAISCCRPFDGTCPGRPRLVASLGCVGREPQEQKSSQSDSCFQKHHQALRCGPHPGISPNCHQERETELRAGGWERPPQRGAEQARALGEGRAAWLLGPPSLLPAEAERPQGLMQSDHSWASQEAPPPRSVRHTQPESAQAEDTELPVRRGRRGSREGTPEGSARDGRS